MDHFEEFIKDLGKALNIPLYLDKNRACCLKINDTFRVQIEMDPSEQRVLIASFISPIPPGKFRENVLKEALKENYLHPQSGVFAYSARDNQLTYFKYLDFSELTGEKMKDILGNFIQKVLSWKDALEQGLSSPNNAQANRSGLPSIFGL